MLDEIVGSALLESFAEQAQNSTWVSTWETVAFLGTADFFAVAIPLLFAFVAARVALRLAAGFALSASLVSWLKVLVDRPRIDPTAFGLGSHLEHAGVYEDPAFPSGHVLMATVIWGLVAVHARGRGAVFARVSCALLIAAIAISRLALLRHDLLDICGGLFLGLILLAAIVLSERHWLDSLAALPRVERAGLWMVVAMGLQLWMRLPITALVLGVGAGLGAGSLGFAGWKRRADKPSLPLGILRALLGIAGVAVVRTLVPMEDGQSQLLLFAAYALGGMWIGGLLPAITGGVTERANPS